MYKENWERIIKPDPASTDGFERYPYEEKFNEFLSSLKDMETSVEEDINGQTVKYAKLSSLIEGYNSSFGSLSLSSSAILHRVKVLIEGNAWGEDIQKIESNSEKQSFEPKYYVNISNRELLKKLFVPMDSKWEEVAGDVRELEASRINHERFDEDEG
ncbi:MAG: hypothetical protein V4665_03030 [Patescibacteria group bacterium]